MFERTREIGLLRAVGASRPQIRAMVRWEAVIIALLGTLGGTVLGIAFGWAIIHGLGRDNNLLFSVPVRQAVVIILLGGLLTWVFGQSGDHIGASGVVFGYFGALLGAAIFERRPATIAPALVAVMLYYGLIVGLVPQPGISWEGHLFGVVTGLASAKVLVGPRKPRRHGDDELDLSAFPPDFDFGQPEK